MLQNESFGVLQSIKSFKGVSKIIEYPLLQVKLSISSPRKLSSYINVKTNANSKGTFETIGKTETILSTETPVFEKVIDINFFVGVYNHQKILFEIYDGDYLSLSNGFLFATVDVFVTDLCRCPTLKIIRGEDTLGYLSIKTVIKSFQETLSLVSFLFKNIHKYLTNISLPHTPNYVSSCCYKHHPYIETATCLL